jgi:hypothetical protein
MHPALILPASICFRLSAKVAAAAVLVAGDRAVLLTQESLAAERVAVEVEAALVRIAVPPRRSWRRLAILDGARVLPRHVSARLFDDLPYSFGVNPKLAPMLARFSPAP